MSDIPAAPRWRILISPRWIGWHVFSVAAVIGMTWMGDWQLRRALAGNSLSWAYTFEWPIFAVFGVFFWIKTIRDELHPATDQGPHEGIPLPAGVRQRAQAAGGPGGGSADDDQQADGGQSDTELAEYNAYLAKLNKEVRNHGRWHGLR